jgi:hypothetical protein
MKVDKRYTHNNIKLLSSQKLEVLKGGIRVGGQTQKLFKTRIQSTCTGAITH